MAKGWRTTMRVFRFPLRRTLRLRTVYPRSSSPRQWLCTTSAPVAQFPESSKERVLELVDHFQSQSKVGPKYLQHLDEFREWARRNNEPPRSKILEILFSMCVRSGEVSDAEIALEFAETHRLRLGEGQINAIITNLAKFGDYARTKEVFQRMCASGTDFRITSLCGLLQRAASERDFPFMLSLEGQLSRHRKTLKNHKLVEEMLKPVFQECTSVMDPAVHEVARVMIDTYRYTRQKPGRETAEALCQWFKNYPQYSFKETTVDHSGVCRGCGLSLESGDISLDELQLLRDQIESILRSTINQSPNVDVKLRKLEALNTLLTSCSFGAILDGLNVAHVFQRYSPDRQQLLHVAAEATNITGKPVLAMMRMHCSSWLMPATDPNRTLKEVATNFQHLGLRIFFTDNRDEDDLYTLYAALFSEPSTFLVTNDFQGVNRGRLPHEYIDIFEQWLRRRLATLIRVGKHVKIKFPLVYDDAIQWSPQNSGPSWKNLHIPLNYRRNWLCISQQLQEDSIVCNSEHTG